MSLIKPWKIGTKPWKNRHQKSTIFFTVSFFTVYVFLNSRTNSKLLSGEARGPGPLGGTQLVVFPRPNRPQFKILKAQAGTPCPLPLPKGARGGEGSRPEGGGGPARREVGVPVHGVLRPVRVKKRGNTTRRVPPTSRDPSHFPILFTMSICRQVGHGKHSAA